jgi:hypothetical protein
VSKQFGARRATHWRLYLSQSNGYIVDEGTGALLARDRATSTTSINQLVVRTVRRCDAPEVLQTDNSWAFDVKEFTDLLEFLGIEHVFMPAYRSPSVDTRIDGTQLS